VTGIQILLLGLYVPLSVLLAAYGIHRAHMLFEYLRTRKMNPMPEGKLEEWPTLLVQIPVFNERAVVRRIVDALSKLDYPRDRLRIQILDDSTDDTVLISEEGCELLRSQGIDAKQIRRPNREGFKAGALAAGLEVDDCELVAVFDADFVPPPGVLKEMVPYFAKPGVGLVQARWEHLNLETNLLTKLQGYFLDGHFILEHTYRHRTGRFFNFNGTAGIWRRECIDDAGGWSASSITEDTEISFRAQIKGWEFVYLRDLTVPAEVPADVDAYKGQQHRWAKGYTEVLQQHFGTIWKSTIPLKTKIEATLMLSNHFAFLLMAALTILHLPIVLAREQWHATPIQTALDVLGLNLVVFAFFGFYAVSQWEAGRFTLRRLALAPLALGFGMALMVNSCRAVLESLFGVKTGFVRTPKEGDAPEAGPKKSYKAAAAVGQAAVEIAFGVYLLFSCAILVSRGHIWGVPLNLVVASGFLYLGGGTLQKIVSLRPLGAPAQPAPAPSEASTAPSGAPVGLAGHEAA
jgi:cellulose synthase/poly-beta-1,6-N-acetylglucosamine synthase-like glycosyltransferase